MIRPAEPPLGIGGSRTVRYEVISAGLSLNDLRRHLAQGGADVPRDMAFWPASWLPRIRAWVERQLLLSPSEHGTASP